MKRIARLSVIVLLMLLMSPLAAFAAPQGYMEVELTKKNFNQYFEIKKVKQLDAFGEYDGYSIEMSSKMLKKGYYIYGVKGFAIKGTAKRRYKFTSNKKTYKYTGNTTINRSASGSFSGIPIARGLDNWDYAYGKAWDVKIKRLKGTIIFAEPSNVIGVERKYSDSNKNRLSYAKIKLRYPYYDDTYEEEHWDDATDSYVTDYYCSYDYMASGKQLLG